MYTNALGSARVIRACLAARSVYKCIGKCQGYTCLFSSMECVQMRREVPGLYVLV